MLVPAPEEPSGPVSSASSAAAAASAGRLGGGVAITDGLHLKALLRKAFLYERGHAFIVLHYQAFYHRDVRSCMVVAVPVMTAK